MIRTNIFCVVMCAVSMTNITSADTIRGIDIDFVNIGHTGNAADIQSPRGENSFGAVGYEYRIGRYEITNAQWNAFVLAAGAPTGTGAGTPISPYRQDAYYTNAQQPTNNVSWYEAAQFCNYLTSGDKSKGAYLFSGDNVNCGSFLGIDRDSAITMYGEVYVMPNVNEWYKAAYYKADGSDYSICTNGTNSAPSAGDACFGQTLPYAGPWDVGTGMLEQNGTFDMMGNVWEWNENISGSTMSSMAVMRGGSFTSEPYLGDSLSSAIPVTFYARSEDNNIGFRIASVPEPATLLLLVLGGVGFTRWK